MKNFIKKWIRRVDRWLEKFLPTDLVYQLLCFYVGLAIYCWYIWTHS